eukprot:166771-Pelagomonas_calceolata.AAC.4
MQLSIAIQRYCFGEFYKSGLVYVQRGQGMDKSFKGMMGDALRYDTTEVAGMDFLGSPTGKAWLRDVYIAHAHDDLHWRFREGNGKERKRNRKEQKGAKLGDERPGRPWAGEDFPVTEITDSANLDVHDGKLC